MGDQQGPLTLPEHPRQARLSSESFQCSSLHFPLDIILMLPMRKLGHSEVKEQTEATQPGSGDSRILCARLCAGLLTCSSTASGVDWKGTVGREEKRSLDFPVPILSS